MSSSEMSGMDDSIYLDGSNKAAHKGDFSSNATDAEKQQAHTGGLMLDEMDDDGQPCRTGVLRSRRLWLVLKMFVHVDPL